MYFEQAKPVWGKGLQREMNITCGFYAAVCRPSEKAVLRIAVSGFYRVFVNNRFVYYGPVRTAHGFYRVDEIPLTKWLTESNNHVAVETVNYYVNSYYSLKQPGFIQMEISADGKIVAATKEKAVGFFAFRLLHRVRKMQRYSFQRAFGESYRLTPDTDSWRLGRFSAAQPLELEESAEKSLLPRELPLQSYPDCFPDYVLERGEVSLTELPKNPLRDRSLTDISEDFNGYTMQELELCLSDEVQTFCYNRGEKMSERYSGITRLRSGEYETLCLQAVRSGFPVMNIRCLSDSRLYIMFDEVLDENQDVNPLRVQCLNVIRLDIKAGEYVFQGMEPLGYKYLKLVCLYGETEITGLSIREVRCPVPIKKFSPMETLEENIVFEAAVQTFSQNAADLFTDCPTRERAGWLCDSFFIGRAERLFTGANLMEKQFLENFLLPSGFKNLPEGMLPMCYPADHFNGVYIPNWAMWYAIELIDYFRRTEDSELVGRAHPRMKKLVEFFERFENEDGLLERLDSWVFIEWSKANDLIQDISFPTNMTYSAVLKGLGRLYSVPEWIKKGESVAETIRRLSYDGQFFVDNQVYRDGKRVLSGERTETCQYYAFFFDIASPETYPELWKRLVEDFGPHRTDKGLYPEIYPSNAFIGNYLRLDILLRYGLYDVCRRQVTGYFTEMARNTGTLWENMTPGASCNHGFACYAAYLLYYACRREQPDRTADFQVI